MPYSAASIANAFLSKAFAERNANPISPMKVQKLAYFAHGYMLSETGEPLLDELFEAWKFGPVLPSLYHECKRYGNGSIKEYIQDYDYASGRYCPAPVPDDRTALDIVDYVWRIYGPESAIDLSDWTHAKNGPWDKITSGGENIPRNKDISNEAIRSYFLDNTNDETSETA
jgi:uncharacterized phage-associated protein